METLSHLKINNPQIPTKPNESPIPVASLISALQHAAQSTQNLSSSSQSETLTALRTAHHLIGSLISQIEESVKDDEDEPMHDRREGEFEAEDESKTIEEVEEGMRECVLQSKRRKRQVSPSWSTGRAADRGEEISAVHPMDRSRSALDLVCQFHA